MWTFRLILIQDLFVKRLTKASAANRTNPGRWGLSVDQKCVELIDFSYFYQTFTLMSIHWTFEPHRPGLIFIVLDLIFMHP